MCVPYVYEDMASGMKLVNRLFNTQTTHMEFLENLSGQHNT